MTIYLDNAATTFPKPESVYLVMDKFYRKCGVNAGRGSYRLAQSANNLISETKDKIRRLVKARSSVPVILTSSITIAMNQIINGLELRDCSIVYVTPYEHNAVARVLHHLGKNKKLIIREIPLNKDLSIDIERMKYLFSKENPDVVFCNHISNVTGYILPVKDIFLEAKRYGSINILDGAQSLGLIDVDVNNLNVDLMGFAGHKALYGPFGIGGFINVSNIKLETFLVGGTGSDSLNLEMPSGYETSFEFASSNIVAVAGLNEALSVLDTKEHFRQEKEICEYAIDRLKDIKGIKLYIPDDLDSHIGIFSFIIKNYNSPDIGMILDEEFDIAVRTGYHCAPFIHKYLNDENNLGTVRVSVGQFTTKEDIDALLIALNDLR